MNALARLAVDSAMAASASYADVRIVRKRAQRVGAEDMRVTGV